MTEEKTSTVPNQSNKAVLRVGLLYYNTLLILGLSYYKTVLILGLSNWKNEVLSMLARC